MKKMNIPFSPPDITELEEQYVIEALRSGWITTGPQTKTFEKEIAEFCGTEKAVCLNSATAALELTLRLIGVGKGDEVIVPAYTYSASCSVIYHVGATPVMCDVKENSFEMDYEKMEDLITKNTKAIIPVDLGGIICDYDSIIKAVENKKSLFHATNIIQENFGRCIIIADSAHGFGASRNGKKSGQFADFTCYSFHAVKNLTTAEGGAVTWVSRDGLDNELIYKDYQLCSLHGQTKDALSKSKSGAWEYDIVNPLYKCNMTDIHSSIGRAQLKRYPEMLKRRKEIISAYDSNFEDLNVTLQNHYSDDHQSSGHLYLLRVNGINEAQRNKIIEELADRGISTNVHYKPLPMFTAYSSRGFHIEDYMNAYNQFCNEITLPVFSIMTDEQLNYIIEQVKDVIVNNVG